MQIKFNPHPALLQTQNLLY